MGSTACRPTEPQCLYKCAIYLPFFSVRELTVGSIFQWQCSSNNVNIRRWLLNDQGFPFVSLGTGPVHMRYGCKYTCQILCQLMCLRVKKYWKVSIHSCRSCVVWKLLCKFESCSSPLNLFFENRVLRKLFWWGSNRIAEGKLRSS